MEDAAKPSLDVTTYGKDSSNLWIVKVPAYLGKKWLEHAHSGREVGKVSIVDRQGMPRVPGQKSGSMSRIMQYTAAPDLLNDEQELPSKKARNDSDSQFQALGRAGAGAHHRNQNKTKLKMRMESTYTMKQLDSRESLNNALQVVFTETKTNPPDHENESRALRGKVTKFYELEPNKTAEYYKFKKDRTKMIRTPKMETAITEPKAMEAIYQAGTVKTNQRKEEQQKKSRVDMDEAQIEAELFGMFKRHQYYKFDDLVSELNQPRSKVEAVLKGIGTYNTGHPRKNMWELKEDYKDY